MDAVELIAALQDARRERDAEMRRRFSRSLPFPELVFDRWERARSLGFADGASIYDSALVYGDVTVGAHTWIGPNVLLDGSGGPVRLGEYCSVASGAHIYTHDTVLWALSGGALGKRTGQVTVGDCVYIGAQSLILPGASIGSRCVIAANSLVNADVAEGTIVAGTPARRIGRVTGEGAAIRLVYDDGAPPAST